MTASSAPDADTLACAIAARYAGRWAQALARPEDDAAGAPAPWFVDGFAGADLQRAALRSATVQPPAIAAVQALGEGARVVLIEEDPGLISRLCEALDGIDAVERIRVTSDPAATQPGEIALVEGSFTRHAAQIASGIGDDPALVRLAPLTAKALPWDALEAVAALSAADVLLRVPLEDFARQGRFTGPMADLPPHIRRVVDGCSALLADPRHGWVPAWREAQRTGGPDAAAATVIARMQALLADVEDDRSTHALPISGASGAVHLLLSTPHAAHPLELDAALAEGAARPKRPSARKSAKSAAPAPAPTPPAAPAAPAAPDAAAVDAPTPAAAPDLAADPTPAVPPESTDREELAALIESPVSAELPHREELPEPEEPLADAELPEPEESSASVEVPEPEEPPASVERPEAEEPSARAEPPKAKKPPRRAELPQREEPADFLDLFAFGSRPEPEPRGPDLQAVADELHARHIGAPVPVRELLTGAADSGLTGEQMYAALALLKRAGRAAYRSLDTEGAEVEFLAEARFAAPRPRKPRKPAPGELGLFDEPEE